MTSEEAVKEIERLTKQHTYAGDHQALQGIARLLEHVTATTTYVDEKKIQLKEAARAFYGRNAGLAGLDESQCRTDLVLALERLKIALKEN